MKRIDVVIVNWNGGDGLRRAIKSLSLCHRKSFDFDRIVIVDNGSTDGSADIVISVDLPVVIIRNDLNIGFAAACNQGAIGSSADLILFLNPDAEVYSSTINDSVDWISDKSHSRAGVCSVQLEDENGHVARSSTRQMTPYHVLVAILGLDKLWPCRFRTHFMEEWAHDETRRVPHVIGAFYLVRRVLFDRLGGFDERFFVYLEDLDLSRRVVESGYEVWYLAHIQAFHLGGGTSEQVKPTRLFYSLRSRILFGHKHFSRPVAILLAAFTLVAEPAARVAYLAARGDRKGISETIKGFRRLWSHAPALLSGDHRSLAKP